MINNRDISDIGEIDKNSVCIIFYRYSTYLEENRVEKI